VTLTSTELLKSVRVLTFVDDHTLVVVRSKDQAQAPTKQTLQQVLAGGAPLRNNAQLAGVLSRTKISAGFVAVSRPQSEAIRKSIAQTGVAPAYFYGSIDLAERFDLHYAMDMRSPDDATQVANMMKGQLGSAQIKSMFDRIEVGAQDKTVTLDVTLGETKLASLAGMLRGLFPPP
jgi:hypothetical protein